MEYFNSFCCLFNGFAYSFRGGEKLSLIHETMNTDGEDPYSFLQF